MEYSRQGLLSSARESWIFSKVGAYTKMKIIYSHGLRTLLFGGQPLLHSWVGLLSLGINDEYALHKKCRYFSLVLAFCAEDKANLPSSVYLGDLREVD